MFWQKEDKNKDKSIKYISSGILLNMAIDEYTKERERANVLDNKASFFITVIVAVATIAIPIIPFSKLTTFFCTVDSCACKCISSILLVGIILAFVVLVIAFKKLYGAYKLIDYMRPNLDCINEQDNHTIPNDRLNKGLCDHYRTVVDNNIKVNDQKCRSIDIGIELCGIGIMILLIATIGLIITIGG